MNKPLISVVIPTRNRPDTLAICLRAMQHHTSQSIEIVVQDNCSHPETFKIISAAIALDPRIRYSKAPFPCSMRQNFEFGLAAAKGNYLSIIGDDDGYSIGSLDSLVKLLSRTPVDAVRWNQLHYVWPSLSEDGEGFMDFFTPMVGGGRSIEAGSKLASRIIQAELKGSWDNICVYHGMISRRVYERMKVMTDGKFFAYPIPDIYTHNIIPFFCDTYLQVNDIISIYGVSGHSTGASWSNGQLFDQEAAAEANRWAVENLVDPLAQKDNWHPQIRTARYHDFVVLKIAENHDMLNGQTADLKVWTHAIIAELKMNPVRLPAWFSIEPKMPYDAEIIAAVRAAFPNGANAVSLEINNKRQFNAKLPSTRLKNIDPLLNDNIEGAMKALQALVGGSAERFDTPARKTSSSTAFISVLANYVRKKAPGLSSRIFNSRFIPAWLWRYIKMTQWGTKN